GNIDDEEIARAVHCHVAKEEIWVPGRDGRDRAGRGIHAPDAVVARIDDEEIARAVEHHATGAVEAGRGRRPAVAAEVVAQRFKWAGAYGWAVRGRWNWAGAHSGNSGRWAVRGRWNWAGTKSR